ncbi:MAG: hypothetical protein HY860_01300, partial [Chlamydiales bacterium]|nr:hypothetical protein [Chlamydiales bacterium]
ALHQLELSRLEINGDQYPYGLNLFWRCALMKQHGASPSDGLKLHSLFNQLKEKLKHKDYLPSLIKQYFLDNNHFLEVVFSPDKTLAQRELEEEKAKLKQISTRLSEKEKKQILKEQKQLKKFQETDEGEEVMNCLPKLTLNDIPLKTKDFSLLHEKTNDLDVYYHDCFTNDFIYVDINYPLGHVETKQLPYLQLFVSILTELGAKKRSYVDNLSLIQQYTGGISTGLSLHGNGNIFDEFYPEFSIKGKCLKRNQVHLAKLMRDFLCDIRLDEKDRIKELILQMYTHMQSRMNKAAMSYATKYALSSFSKLGSLKNALTGIEYYRFICSIGKHIDTRLDDVLYELNNIKQKILHLQHPSLVLSCTRNDIEDEFFQVLKGLPTHDYKAISFDLPKVDIPPTAFTISSPVAFNVFAIPCVGFTHPLAGAMNILSDLISDVYLHKKIREQGGAYGSGASYHPLTHAFHFYSYRDPHVVDTFDIFYDAIDQIAKGKFKSSQVEEAIFEVMQDLDTPLSPGSRASLAYSWKKMHRDKPTRQSFREKMISVTKEDLKDSAKILKKNYHSGKKIVFASESMIEEENKKMEHPFLKQSTSY